MAYAKPHTLSVQGAWQGKMVKTYLVVRWCVRLRSCVPSIHLFKLDTSESQGMHVYCQETLH